jgi:tryptophan synthase alpha chain
MFERLARANEGAFVPFCMISDPSPQASERIIGALVRGGADALELGLPFSDPIADGPVIQAAAVRALGAGAKMVDAWRILERVRARFELPVGLLVYANLVEAAGRDAFYARAAAAGVDSVLVADVPTVEAEPFAEAAGRHGVEPVLIATPDAGEEEVLAVARLCRGYTYVVTRRGVTGSDDEAGGGHAATVAALKRSGAPPAILGFGISRPEHVRAGLSAGAAGVIAGSAVVKIVARHLEDPDVRDARIVDYVAAMKAATLAR